MRPISRSSPCRPSRTSLPPPKPCSIAERAEDRQDEKDMATPILMPALSPTMEKGKLAKWLKHEGDTVRSGDVIAEIETDKATMEVEAVDEGRLGKIMVPEGTDDVAVNTPIAMILAEGEDASSIAASAPQPAPAKPAEAKPAEAKPAEAKPAEVKP